MFISINFVFQWSDGIADREADTHVQVNVICSVVIQLQKTEAVFSNLGISESV